MKLKDVPRGGYFIHENKIWRKDTEEFPHNTNGEYVHCCMEKEGDLWQVTDKGYYAHLEWELEVQPVEVNIDVFEWTPTDQLREGDKVVLPPAILGATIYEVQQVGEYSVSILPLEKNSGFILEHKDNHRVRRL